MKFFRFPICRGLPAHAMAFQRLFHSSISPPPGEALFSCWDTKCSNRERFDLLPTNWSVSVLIRNQVLPLMLASRVVKVNRWIVSGEGVLPRNVSVRWVTKKAMARKWAPLVTSKKMKPSDSLAAATLDPAWFPQHPSAENMPNRRVNWKCFAMKIYTKMLGVQIILKIDSIYLTI